VDLGPMAVQTKKEPGALTEKLNVPCFCAFFVQVQDTIVFLIIIKVILYDGEMHLNVKILLNLPSVKSTTSSSIRALISSGVGSPVNLISA